MSGARDVADLLRMVPGFESTTSFETDAPMVSYHGRSDDFSNRLQVLVDGRAVYSGFLFGSTGIGLQTLALDDIERIEVLRGSNSAAYGARAFLGVVNIISRDVRETLGARGSVTAGENGVADASASQGWGEDAASFRLSLDSRGDAGLKGAYGENRIDRANFSSHFSIGGGSELDLRAGATRIRAGRGSTDPSEYGNASRMRDMESRFLQLDWSKNLDPDHDLLLSASHTEITNNDHFPYLDPAVRTSGYYGITIDFSAREFLDSATLQYTARLSPDVRTVAGMELRSELIISPSGFDQRGRVATHFSRFFGDTEWRINPTLFLNAGLMAENNDISGGSVSPRLMLNWHASDGHTLRGGVSTAFRPPSAYEKYALVRYYDINGQNPTPPYVQVNGNVGAERIVARELGYHLNLPGPGLSGDMRLFSEQVNDGIWCNPDQPTDCINKDNYTSEGAEYQLSWKPSAATQVFFNQAWMKTQGLSYTLSSNPLDKHWFRVTHAAPELATALAVTHTFDCGVSLSTMIKLSQRSALMSNQETGELHSSSRWDLRLAKNMRLGRHKAELALTVQNLGDPYQDGGVSYQFVRRALVSLRLEN
jgi:iron complex outermembrane receptor protein